MNDIDFIKNPMRWPRWPLLPLVHRRRSFGEKGAVGAMVAEDKLRVYEDLNIFAATGRTLTEVIGGLETVEYSTPEDLLADWRID